MNANEKITEVLNRDPRTKIWLSRLNEIAAETGASDEALREARQKVYVLMILRNKEAFRLFAEDIYHQLQLRAKRV